MKPLFFALLASSLFAAGCAVKDVGADPAVGSTDHAGDVVPAATGCTLQRPMTWTVNGTVCHESASGPLAMTNGQQYTAIGAGGGIYGTGTALVTCSNGTLVFGKKSCRPGGGSQQ